MFDIKWIRENPGALDAETALFDGIVTF